MPDKPVRGSKLTRGFALIHPVLFAAGAVIFLFAQNVYTVDVSEVLPSIGISAGLAVVSLRVFSLVFPENLQKSALVSSVFVLWFFHYGHIYDAAMTVLPGLTRHKTVLPIWVSLLLGFGYSARKSRRRFAGWTTPLNTIASLLVIMSLVGVAAKSRESRQPDLGGSATGYGLEVDAEGSILGNKGKTQRDIYYIILDAYSGTSALKAVYGYDNGAFVSRLREKGFYVASGSTANYVLTAASLASSLNMQYVNYLSDTRLQSDDVRELDRMIRRNEVVRFLKSRGYKYVHISSGWQATDANEDADLSIRFKDLSQFELVLLRTTVLRPLVDRVLGAVLARQRLLGTFSALSMMPQVEGPKFVFAHIISPHPPYLFDTEGKPAAGSELEMNGHVWEQRNSYLGQLIFVSKKAEEAIDEILAKSPTPPIIVLQSDHGPAATLYSSGRSFWDRPDSTMLEERTGILNALYLPGGGSDSLYESITPVNTFRVIFDHYFDTRLKLLPDRIYWSTYRTPYNFIDVTDKVRQGS